MGFFALDYVFGPLKIRKLCGESFRFNESAIKFHQRFKFHEEGLLRAHVLKDGAYEDVVVFALFAEDWMKHREKIANLCFR